MNLGRPYQSKIERMSGVSSNAVSEGAEFLSKMPFRASSSYKMRGLRVSYAQTSKAEIDFDRQLAGAVLCARLPVHLWHRDLRCALKMTGKFAK